MPSLSFFSHEAYAVNQLNTCLSLDVETTFVGLVINDTDYYH
jgi:hypothetical protein